MAVKDHLKSVSSCGQMVKDTFVSKLRLRKVDTEGTGESRLRRTKSVEEYDRIIRETIKAPIAGLKKEFYRRRRRLLVVEVDEVPLTYREEAITGGYRKPSVGWIDCLLSAVTPLNNETLNFWTHFVVFWYFVYLFNDMVRSGVVSTSKLYHRPFILFMFTCCLWPIVSCAAHLFHVMGERARHLCFFFDYTSLSSYAFCVAVAYRQYCFDRSFCDDYYLPIAAASCMFCTFLACYSRLLPKKLFCPKRKISRIAAFVAPYLLVNLPLLNRLFRNLFFDRTTNTVSGDEAFRWHFGQFVSTGISMLFYTSHIPERLAPGRFDLIGHSHQWFHLWGSAATYCQIRAMLLDMLQKRHGSFEADYWPNACWLTMLVLAGNCLIVGCYVHRVLSGRWNAEPSEQQESDMCQLQEKSD